MQIRDILKEIETMDLDEQCAFSIITASDVREHAKWLMDEEFKLTDDQVSEILGNIDGWEFGDWVEIYIHDTIATKTGERHA